jgi:hypothetical protein
MYANVITRSSKSGHAGKYEAHMASGAAIACAIDQFSGSAREDEMLKCAFAHPGLFNQRPESYVQTLAGWDRYISVVNRQLNVQMKSINTPPFTLKRKRAASEPLPGGALSDGTNNRRTS